MSDFGAKIASLIVLSGLLPAGSASMGRPSPVREANLPQLSGVGSYPCWPGLRVSVFRRRWPLTLARIFKRKLQGP